MHFPQIYSGMDQGSKQVTHRGIHYLEGTHYIVWYHWDGLAWKVGNGRHFYIGLDPWPGNGLRHILSAEVLAFLDHQNICFLAQLTDRNTTNLWHRGWKDWQQLNLPEGLADH